MIIENEIAHLIDTAGDRARYDECVKKLLARKAILAWILKNCAEEFKSYTVDYIMDECIEGVPDIATKAVLQDHLDAVRDGDQGIQGLNAEDTSILEHTVTYDIRFSACVPGSNGPVQMIINVEAQLDTTPGYPLTKRGIYYCCRMISAQYGTVFNESEYEKIKKVYSIWVCPTPSKKRSNTIQKYSMTEENILGDVKEDVNNYDLLTVIFLRLGKAGENSENELIRLLSVLLSSEMTSADKKRILNDDFAIAMTTEFESEVLDMCNLSQGIWEQGINKGRIEGEIKGVVKTCRNMGFDDQQVIDKLVELLQLSKEEAEQYVLENIAV